MLEPYKFRPTQRHAKRLLFSLLPVAGFTPNYIPLTKTILLTVRAGRAAGAGGLYLLKMSAGC